MTADRALVLTDNGSKRPAAFEALAGYAAALSARLGRPVTPVSMMHTPTPPGATPRTMKPFLAAELAAGRGAVGVVPVFLGPSGAVTAYLARTVDELAAADPRLDVAVGDFLYRDDEPALVELLLDHIRDAARGLDRPEVVLVDHGSPNPAVTAVRDRLAARLAAALGPEVSAVTPASMERRPGPEYAFNDPLLPAVLAEPSRRSADVVLAMLFFSPGRHAGPGGDIAEMLAEAAATGGPRVVQTPLLGEHPGLIDLLAARAAALLG